jgi:hypothetical protein
MKALEGIKLAAMLPPSYTLGQTRAWLMEQVDGTTLAT